MKLIKATNAACKLSSALNIPMAELVDLFADIQEIEAEPVMHGRWQEFGVKCYVCNRCNYGQHARTYFCPVCGARMEWEE